jgi:thymidylate kinase
MASGLLGRLVEALNCEQVVYCHWKGNFSLPEVLSGEKDFELLVDRQSLAQTTAILLRLGYKPAAVKWESETPGVSHYYGYDPQRDQFVHVHLCDDVVTGESFINSHWLPFEAMLFANTSDMGGLRMPSRSAELVVFTLRTFIRYGSPLDLMYLIRESGRIQEQFRWLQDGTDPNEVLGLVGEFCPVVDQQLFSRCLEALRAPTSIHRKILVGRQVRGRLQVYARFSSLGRLLAYAQLLWGQGLRRLSANRRNKTLRAGGAIIALVGPEATGKSTLAEECRRWLGGVFAVKVIHAGKPPSTWLTAPMNKALPLIRRLLPGLRTSRLEGHVSTNRPTGSPSASGGLPALIYALRAVSVAWDRRQLLVKARRSAAHGDIIICDRYPSETIGTMDSPRLRECSAQTGIGPAIHNWLARLEHRLYEQIPPPDIVLQLNVSLETAKQRNRERIKADKESDAYVESRHRQHQDWHKAGTRHSYDIDTGQPLAETILSVKRAIWESL